MLQGPSFDTPGCGVLPVNAPTTLLGRFWRYRGELPRGIHVGILTLHVLKTFHYMFLWYKQTQMKQKSPMGDLRWDRVNGVDRAGQHIRVWRDPATPSVRIPPKLACVPIW